MFPDKRRDISFPVLGSVILFAVLVGSGLTYQALVGGSAERLVTAASNTVSPAASRTISLDSPSAVRSMTTPVSPRAVTGTSAYVGSTSRRATER